MNTQEWLDTLAAMDSPAMHSIGVGLVAENESLRAKVKESEAECLEQARLNGMGGEREAALLGKVARMEAVISWAAAVKPTGNTVEWAEGLIDRILALPSHPEVRP